MYKKFFGFIDRPFQLLPNPAYLFLSRSHEETLAHLVYAVSHGDGFVEVTGEVGTGKTTLCRVFLESLDDDVEVAYIFNPKLNALQLIKAINDEFGIQSDAENIKDLIDILNTFLIEKKGEGKTSILLIDEAQNLSMEVLEQLRLLSNLETSSDKLLQIILVGQPELADMLASRELRQLSQRITLRCQLSPLGPTESIEYIKHRINVASQEPFVKFTKAAYRLIYKYSGGVPRLINIVCDRALLTAFGYHKHTISGSIVKGAVKELTKTGELKPATITLLRKDVLGAAAICLALLLLILFYPKNLNINSLIKTKSADKNVQVVDVAPDVKKEITSPTTPSPVPEKLEQKNKPEPGKKGEPVIKPQVTEPEIKAIPAVPKATEKSPPNSAIKLAQATKAIGQKKLPPEKKLNIKAIPVVPSEKEKSPSVSTKKLAQKIKKLEPGKPPQATKPEIKTALKETSAKEKQLPVQSPKQVQTIRASKQKKASQVIEPEIKTIPKTAALAEKSPLDQTQKQPQINIATAPKMKTVQEQQPKIIEPEVKAIPIEPYAAKKPLPDAKQKKIQAKNDFEQFLLEMDIGSSRYEAITVAVRRWDKNAAVKKQIIGKLNDAEYFRLAAQQNGLSVRKVEGSLNVLKSLNMPAVLELQVPGNSSPGYLTISEISNNKVTLNRGADTIEIDGKQLSKYWAGIIYLPWKNFLNFTGTIPINSPGESTVALKKLLQELGHKGLTINNTYDERTKQIIKNIQEKNRINNDGVVGSLTKIAIYNEKKDLQIPRIVK